MNVPYTVCHILSALDGRISGAFMGLDSVHDAAAPTQGYASTTRLMHGYMEAPRPENSSLPLLLIHAASHLMFHLILRQRKMPGSTMYQ